MSKLNLHHKIFLFCLALITVRIIQTEKLSFLFLFWNLFLAWMPYRIAKFLDEKHELWLKIPLMSLCIVFLPNAPYIVTDLFHLKKQLTAPLWLDTFLILGFAVLGLIFFIKALDRIIYQISLIVPSKFSFCIKPLLFLATGYGIYVGRYLRYNSWDIVVRPFELASGMFWSVFNPHQSADTIGATITFTVFLYLVFEIYLSFRKKDIQISK